MAASEKAVGKLPDPPGNPGCFTVRMQLLRAAVVAGAIPWIPAIPRAALVPPIAPPCRSAALEAQLGLQGATGSLAGGVSLTNRAGESCSLRGRVEVRFLDGSDPAGVHLTTLAPQQPEPGVLIPSLRALRPGESAFVPIWWSNWCGEPSPTRLGLRLPSGDMIDLALGTGAPRCDARASPSALAVGPAEPRPARPRPSTRLPLAAAIVEQERLGATVIPSVHGRRGRSAVYHVALTNNSSRPFHFGASCPIYAEGTGPDQPVELHVLNCHPVGTMRPGSRVVFEMRIRIPPGLRPGRHALTWELAPASYLPPFAGGTIVVTG
jgi:hypothetical protein